MQFGVLPDKNFTLCAVVESEELFLCTVTEQYSWVLSVCFDFVFEEKDEETKALEALLSNIAKPVVSKSNFP